MPIETRLNNATSKLIQSHHKPQTDKLSSIHQSVVWSDWYDGTFNGDNRVLALGLSADGLNPFERRTRTQCGQYSFVLNLLSQMWKNQIPCC